MCDPRLVGSRVVLFDGFCSFCRFSQQVVDALDWFRAFQWLPFQKPGAERFGISPELLEARMYLVSGSRQWSGFAAWKQILVRLPATWILIAASALLSPYLLVAWLLLFLPFTAPIGERVYYWIARHRHRLPGSTCRLEP